MPQKRKKIEFLGFEIVKNCAKKLKILFKIIDKQYTLC